MSEAALAGWRAVEVALLRYRGRHGASAPFWLRDDDAVAPSAALDRLLRIADRAGAPLSLAVIPALAEASLRAHLDALPEVAVLQHGFAHANNAPPGEKRCEFAAGRDRTAMEGEVAEGRRCLAGFAGFVPIFVPPWNRVAPTLLAALPGLGFGAVSAFGDRPAPLAAAGLAALGTHVDPVSWHGGRGFLGAERVLEALAGRLDRLTLGEADAGEPTGLLTHHLVHDAQTFAFLEDLLVFLSGSGLVQWLSGSMLLARFGPGERMVVE